LESLTKEREGERYKGRERAREREREKQTGILQFPKLEIACILLVVGVSHNVAHCQIKIPVRFLSFSLFDVRESIKYN